MKTAWISFIVIVLLTSCSEHPGWKRFGLKGKVKSFTERTYDAEKKFGKWENGDLKISGHNKTMFNESGEITEIDYLDEDLKLTTKYIPTYKDDNVIEENYFDESGALNSSNKFTNISSDKKEYERLDKEGRKEMDEILYYSKNQITKSIINSYYNGNVLDVFTATFEYDKNNHLISMKQVNKKGEIILFIKFEYLEFDQKGNWTKRLNYDESDEENPKSIFIREYEYY